MIRVVLPGPLRQLARINGELALDVNGRVTSGAIIDAVEARYPMLQGAIRDHTTHRRRAFVRFYACEQDWSHEPSDRELPPAVADGKEPFLVVGALAGG